MLDFMTPRAFHQEIWWRLKEESESFAKESCDQAFCKFFFKDLLLPRLPYSVLLLLEPAQFYFIGHEEIPGYCFPKLVLLYDRYPLLLSKQPELELFCSQILETAYIRHLVVSGENGRIRRLISFSTSDRRWTSQSLTEV